MKISRFLRQTLIDYPEKLAAEIFVAGCNYKCYSCHAKHIIEGGQFYDEQEVLSYLKKTRGFIGGVVICGGEPTLQYDLPEFLERIKKETGLLIKLDTNGSNSEVLEKLIEKKLVDYIALDIKGSKNLYPVLTGESDAVLNVERSIAIIQKAPDYEFRTTVVPIIRTEKTGEKSWMTLDETKEMAEWVSDFVNINKREVRWYLQKFIARRREETAMLDERFCKENLKEGMRQTP